MPDGEPRARSTSLLDVRFFFGFLYNPLHLICQDSDLESHGDDGSANPPGRPGRKKNPKYVICACYCYALQLTLFSSQAARRDQNRIAQREFRLRKQQRVSPSSNSKPLLQAP